MAKDLLKVLQEIRGTGTPEGEYTDGIYHDITIKDTDTNGDTRLAPGMYGSMQVMYESTSLIAPHIDEVIIVADNIDDVVLATKIIYAAGVPATNINPTNGTNALYVDTNTNTSYICKDATPDNNIWIINGSGQYHDIGTSIGKGVSYTAQVSGVEDIIVKPGTNGFSIDNFTLVDGASITIEDGAVYKVL